MFKPLQIIDEKDKILRRKAKNVDFPLSKEEKDLIKQILKHLKYSQIATKSEKYKLRPGMGLAFPQVGILKRVIVLVHEEEENKFTEYVIVNPEIISHSVAEVAAYEGEGCLSVNRDIEGHVKRYARISLKGFDENGQEIELRARDELAIAIQHEIDHLEGILFFDRIDKNKPFYNEDEITLI